MDGLVALSYLGVIGFIGWGIYKWVNRPKPGRRPPPTIYGSATFASWDDLDAYGLTAGKGYPVGVWFGRWTEPDAPAECAPRPPVEARSLTYSGDRHPLICAPTR